MFVMDNATNNDTMVEALAQRCKNENIPFSSSRFRVRFMPHTVHLAAIKLLEIIGAASKDAQKKAVSRSASHPYQDMVNGITDSPEDAELRDDEIVADGTAATVDTDQQEAARFQICVQNGEHDIAFAVQKLRRIIKHVRSSPQRRKKWEGQIRLNADELDAALAKAELILILDNLELKLLKLIHTGRALGYRGAVDVYIAAEKDLCTTAVMADEDWNAIQLVSGWLGLFKGATTKMSTIKKPMLSQTHAIFRTLQSAVQSRRSSEKVAKWASPGPFEAERPSRPPSRPVKGYEEVSATVPLTDGPLDGRLRTVSQLGRTVTIPNNLSLLLCGIKDFSRYVGSKTEDEEQACVLIHNYNCTSPYLDELYLNNMHLPLSLFTSNNLDLVNNTRKSIATVKRNMPSATSSDKQIHIASFKRKILAEKNMDHGQWLEGRCAELHYLP
ncbi:hypothetical protein DFH08DRAFT_1051543 [Mycena albidolilacea]|uniref:Uncharacterized protein n=1 Tax=Mycena albidolilacea TaxID=1033008 RepID=A0AAD6Z535_9AGAR|nr:hypothetical protein DFH08DRAFT_1051543 [Mycena albidolilacea]